MTQLENRPHTALLVVDVQNGVVETAQQRDAIIGNSRRVTRRKAGTMATADVDFVTS